MREIERGYQREAESYYSRGSVRGFGKERVSS